MFEKILFDNGTAPILLKSLDAAMLRSKTIANNIANVNTPGYKRVEVSFEDELRQAIDKNRIKGTRTDEQHFEIGSKSIGKVSPRAYRPEDPTLSSGVNNVDVDTEMAKLAENQIVFNYGIRFLRGTYRKLDAAIQGKGINLQ
jgi:flagellar basal-body rod protein FlgB